MGAPTRYVTARASQIINSRGIANTPAHANPTRSTTTRRTLQAQSTRRQRARTPTMLTTINDNGQRRPATPAILQLTVKLYFRHYSLFLDLRAYGLLPLILFGFALLIVSSLMTRLTHRHHPLQVQASIRSGAARYGNRLSYSCVRGTGTCPRQPTAPCQSQ